MVTTTDSTGLAATVLPLIQRFIGDDPDALPKMRNQVQRELQQANAAVERAEAQLRAIDQLQQMAEQAEEANVEIQISDFLAVPFQKPKPPSLRKAIAEVLTVRDLTRDEIYDALVERGWAPGGKNPRNTLTTRLSEMRTEGILGRKGDRYSLAEEREVPAV